MKLVCGISALISENKIEKILRFVQNDNGAKDSSSLTLLRMKMRGNKTDYEAFEE